MTNPCDRMTVHPHRKIMNTTTTPIRKQPTVEFPELQRRTIDLTLARLAEPPAKDTSKRT